MWSEDERIPRNPIIEAMRSAVNHVDELETRLRKLSEEKYNQEHPSEYGMCEMCHRADGKLVAYRPFWQRNFKVTLYLCPTCLERLTEAIDMVRDVLYKDDESYQKWRTEYVEWKNRLEDEHGRRDEEPRGRGEDGDGTER